MKNFSKIIIYICMGVAPFTNVSAVSTAFFRASFTFHNDGFFSCFLMVLGLLDAFEQGKNNYNGVEVNFGESGLYYDPQHGKNWWEYYFFPIPNQNKRFFRKTPTSAELGACANSAYYQIPRTRCKALIDKYIHIRPEVLKIVDDFVSQELKGHPYIAVQYRGTDKNEESFYLRPHEACLKIEKIVCDSKWQNFPIFVATDQAQFLSLMKEKFGKRIVACQANRSETELPIHKRTDLNGYQKGLEALVDCLLLARSQFLIRTSSNLSTAALLFNPNLPSVCLNVSRYIKERES